MVKPLNKEWELFGHKYRVPGAKGDKVDCKACHKQVSAAVNRLQSHLRVCPARPTLPVALLSGHVQQHVSAGELGDDAAAGPGTGLSDAMAEPSDLGEPGMEASGNGAVLTADQATVENASAPASGVDTAAPPAKKPRHSPARTRERPRWNAPTANAMASLSMDDFWFNSMGLVTSGSASATSAALPAAPAGSSAFAKKRLELEEKRLQLEIKRDQREERRERVNLEILEAQARKERLLADKEGYEAKVLLALSRKQLRDQGVREEEIERILPIPSTQVSSNTEDVDDDAHASTVLCAPSDSTNSSAKGIAAETPNVAAAASILATDASSTSAFVVSERLVTEAAVL